MFNATRQCLCYLSNIIILSVYTLIIKSLNEGLDFIYLFLPPTNLNNPFIKIDPFII